jgi:hypothetical protein
MSPELSQAVVDEPGVFAESFELRPTRGGERTGLNQRAGKSLEDVAISSDVRGPSRYERTPDTADSHSY